MNGTVYFGSHDRRFYALSPDGKKLWEFATDGPIISSPAWIGTGESISRRWMAFFTCSTVTVV